MPLESDTPADHSLRGRVVLREGLGAEVIVHFEIDARPALTDDIREPAADVGPELTRARLVNWQSWRTISTTDPGEIIDPHDH